MYMLKVTSEKNLNISRETMLTHLNYFSFTVVIPLWFDHTLILFRKKNYLSFMVKQDDVKQFSGEREYNRI